MADKLYYGWLLAYLSTSPNFGAGLVLKKLGPHTNLKTDIECLCSTIVYFTSHELDNNELCHNQGKLKKIS